MRPLYGSLLLCQVVGKNAHKLLIVRGMASAEMVSPFSRSVLLIPAAIYSSVTCTLAIVSGSDTRLSGFACSREVQRIFAACVLFRCLAASSDVFCLSLFSDPQGGVCGQDSGLAVGDQGHQEVVW